MQVGGASAVPPTPTPQQAAKQDVDNYIMSLMNGPRAGKSRLDRLRQIEKRTKERAKAAKKRDRMRQQMRLLKEQLEEEELTIRRLDDEVRELGNMPPDRDY